ncbi:MAG: glycosyltransferase [Candidatus Methanomethylicaceae archaeon]
MNEPVKFEPLVSIVIPVLNGLQFTLECLTSIQKFTTRVPHEIIVVGTGVDGTVGAMQEMASRIPNFKFIHNPEQVHFARNVNLGAKNSRGTYLCILNNDTIVTPNWLEKLLAVYGRFTSLPDLERPCPPPAVIAPCSNYVMRHQMIKFDGSLESLPDFAREVETKFRGKWLYAAVVSGFCMLVVKEVFDVLGGFDESFINGNEDVDFCARVNDVGYSCIVDLSTFIFHYGSQTFRMHGMLDKDHGMYNRVQAALKYAGDTPTEKKISGNVRLKCSKEELEKWLQRHYDLFDVVNIVDDDSGWDMESYLASNWPKCTYVNMKGAIEVEQRRLLYLLSYEQGMDWMVVLDHDEFLEEKVDRAYLQRLVNAPIPGVQAFVARWIHLWNSPTTYHMRFPPHSGIFLRKVQPNLVYMPGTPGTSLHCSRLPETPIVGTALTNVHVLHYGYVDPQKRARKRDFYENKDPNPIPVLVGGVNYRHLTDQTAIVLSEWLGSDAYTISLCSMAEHEPIHRVQMLLEGVGTLVDEIVFRVPLGSPFIPLLQRWGAKIVEKEWNNHYSQMRNSVLDKATQSYILVMDIDEALTDPGEVIFLVEQQPTAVLFNIHNLQPDGKPPAVTEIMRLFKNSPLIRFNGRLHETIEDDILKIRDRRILRANSRIDHFGFLTPRLPEKLKQYVKLNRKAMHDNPKDPKPYFNLALHYLEEGEIEQAQEHLEKAIELHPKFTLAKIELAKLFLRYARSLILSSIADVPPQHPYRSSLEQMDRVTQMLIPRGEDLVFPVLAKVKDVKKHDLMEELSPDEQFFGRI